LSLGVCVSMQVKETVRELNFQVERKSEEVDRVFKLNATGQDDAGCSDQRLNLVDFADLVHPSEPRMRPLYIRFQLGV
jgi:hypothetical protein